MREIKIHNQKINEFIIDKFGDDRIPFTAGIELTPYCNYSCIHCYAAPNRHKKQLSNYQVKKILDILAENGTIEIFFTGGDPLFREDFSDIYIYAKKRGFMVSVLTNASMLSQELCDVFIEYPLEELSITMYGYTEETFEKITGLKGSYKKFINAVELIKKNNIECELKAIGMKQNIHEIKNIIEFGRNNGFRIIFGFDIRPMNDYSKKPLDLRISAEEAVNFEINDPDRIEFWNLVSQGLIKHRDDIEQRKNENYLYPCDIAKQFVFINCEGKMQGCVKDITHQYDLLKDYDFKTGWEYLGKIRNLKADDSFKCNKCKYFEICEQCTENQVLENRDVNNPVSFYCESAAKRYEFINSLSK